MSKYFASEKGESVLPPLANDIYGTVLVTGGSRGIGKATAMRLAQWGYDVILTWHSSNKKASAVVEEIKNQGGVAQTIQLRLEEDNLQRKFDDIDNLLHSPIVGLVNNAAISGGRSSFSQKSALDWEKVFQINVFGLVTLCKEAFKRMAISEGGCGGSIVNLSSQVANFGGHQLLAYAASKGAVNAITVALAKEVGSQGIRVNAVSPGIIDSHENADQSKLLEAKIDQIPLGRLGTPCDVAELITWLISPLSSFVSGTVIPVHGGR